MKQPSIWILEDDPGSQFMYSECLGLKYDIRFFEDIGPFRAALTQGESPQLLIADLRLKDGTFLSCAEDPKFQPYLEMPFIVVSSNDDLDILRRLFAVGARDYLTKPFNKYELVVKVERALSGGDVVALRPLNIELLIHESRLIGPNGKKIELTPKEMQLIAHMLRAPNNRLSREEIVRGIWGETQVSVSLLNTHISNLRRKLEFAQLKIEFIPPSHFQLLRNWMNEKVSRRPIE